MEFRASLLIEWSKLCSDKLLKPDKLFLENLSELMSGSIEYKETERIFKLKGLLKETRDNLHTLKRIFHNLESYEDENNIYYWYKVYERRCKPYCIRNFLEFLFLDKMTGYFTKPLSVILSIFLYIPFFALIYCLPCFSITNSTIETSEKIFFSLQSIDNLTIFWNAFTSNVSTYFCKSLYFSAITFATIGYGDFSPVDSTARFIAAFEGITGIVIISIFVVTLANKILW